MACHLIHPKILLHEIRFITIQKYSIAKRFQKSGIGKQLGSKRFLQITLRQSLPNSWFSILILFLALISFLAFDHHYNLVQNKS